jgi:hypothetical protein
MSTSSVNGNARFSSISVRLGGNKTYDLRVIGVDNARKTIKNCPAQLVNVSDSLAWVGRRAGAEYALGVVVACRPDKRERD